MQTRTRKGRFVKGAIVCTVGSTTPQTTKGSYCGVDSAVKKREYDDTTPLMGRKVDQHEGGLESRAEWVRYQSGGLTPSELLRAANS